MIGHVCPAITPENVGQMTVEDLTGAAQFFDAKYKAAGE